MASMLEIQNVQVSIADKDILRGVDLKIKQGEIHALMGPNGSGKARSRMRLWATLATK